MNQLQYLAQLAKERRDRPTFKVSDLARYVAEKGQAQNAGTDQAKALERLRGFTQQSQDISQQQSQVFEEDASRSYKLPDRKDLKGGDFTTALVIGALKALAGDHTAGQDTAQILQGRKARKDEQYGDEMTKLQSMISENERQSRSKLGALSAKQQAAQSGAGQAGYEIDLFGKQKQDLDQQAQRTLENAQSQSNWERNFGFTTDQANIENDRWEKEFGFRLDQFEWSKTPQYALAKREYDAMLQDGADPETARLQAFGRFIMDGANAKYQPDILKNQFNLSGKQLEEADENLKRIREMNKWLPKQLQQEFAANELSMANTRQTMAARSIDMEKARSRGNVQELTMLQEAQIKDYDTAIKRNLDLADSLRQSIVDTELTPLQKSQRDRQAKVYEDKADVLRKERNGLLGG